MSQQIVLVSKGSSGAAQRLVLKPGQKVPAAPNQKYQVLVDGKEELPEGSEVVRNGNDLEIRLANGDTVTLTNWAAAEGASLEAGSATLSGGAASAAGGFMGFSPSTLLLGAGLVGGLAAVAAGGGDSNRPPSVPSGVALASSSDSGVQGDNLTNDNTPTITGRGDPGAQIEVRNGGTTIATTTVDSAGAWSATPTSAIADGAVNLQVVSNRGANTATSEAVNLTLTIDTVAPRATVAPDLTAASDTGVSQTDDLTNAVRPAFAIPAPAAGETANLYVDGVRVASTFSAASNSLTPVNAIAPGAHVITYTLTDAAGNESTPSPALGVTIDTTAPTVGTAPDMVAASDSGTSNSDNLTNVARPVFSIPAPGTGNTPSLYVDGQKVAATFDAVANTLTPSGALSQGGHVVTYTLTDAAGNESAQSPTLTVVIDSTPPTQPAAPDLTAPGDSGTSSTDNVTNVVRPAFAIAAPASGETASLYVDGVRVASTYDAVARTLTPVAALAPGSRAIAYTLTDAAGNESPVSPALSVVVDATAPSAPVLAIPEGPLVNSTENNDGVQVNVTAGPGGYSAGDTITVSVTRPDATTATVSRVVTAAEVTAGVAVVSVPAQTVQGAYQLTATVTDLAGNVSPVSAAGAFTLDTVAPAAPTIAVVEAADGYINDAEAISGGGVPVTVTLPAGALAGERVQVTLTGPGAPATIEYTLTGADVGAGTASVLVPTASVANNGSYTATAVLVDAAGNASTASKASSFIVDRTAGGPLAAPDMTAATDSGVSQTDNLTNNTTPVFTGAGAEAGATVTLYDTDGTTVLGTGIADASGNWAITSSTLAAGERTVTVRQVDLAGNAGPASAGLKLTVDTTGPAFGKALTALEDFSSIDVSGTSLSASDGVSKQAALTVSSASFKSATGFVAGDVSISVAGGKATVTPLAGAQHRNGSIVLTVAIQDEAGNATTQDVTITVTPVNDAPVGADKTVTVVEDSSYTLTVADFPLTDPNDSPANALQSVVIATLPTAGTLRLSGVAVTAGQEILAADITAGKLSFTPAADGAGTNYSSFTFQVRDAGGTANGGVNLDASPNKLTIDVTNVNDAPVLDSSKALSFSAPEYVFSGGADAATHAPSGASPAGSIAVSALVDLATPSGQLDNVTDVDAGAKLGVGVTRIAGGLGSTLWYTVDGGTSWEWISNTGGSKVSKGFFGADGVAGGGDDNVLLLADTARFVFDGGNSGAGGSIADALTIRAWDQTSGTNGAVVTNPTTGGTTALSTATDTVQVNFTSSVVDLSRLAPTAGARIAGATAGTQFGQDVSTAGDVNGDGFDDFVVTQYGTTTAAGGATLIYGQAGAFGSVGADGTRSVSVATLGAGANSFGRPGQYFTGVSKIGDINNDGYADFMVSTDLIAGSGSGNAFVVFGGAKMADIPLLGVPSAGGNWFQISQSFYGLGQTNHTISYAGDVNGDGYDDIILGMDIAPAAGAGTFGSGLAVVVYGHAGTSFGAGNNLDLAPLGVDPTTLADTAGPAGYVIHAGTDTRGVVIGAGPSGSGLAWGSAVGGVGDRNGDGYSDYAVISDLGGTLVNGIVLHGKLTTDDGGNVLYFAGPTGSDWVGLGTGGIDGNTGVNNARLKLRGLGTGVPNQVEPDRVAVKGIGDVNGDGYDDFAMAYNGVRNGEVYVIYGNGTVLDNDPVASFASGLTGFKVTGIAAGDKLGESVRAAGDVNGDGYDDFIIGAPRNDTGSAADQGGAFIIYGGADPGANDIDLSTGLPSARGVTIRGGATGDQAGFSVAGAGDVNGDGLADVLVGARSNDQGAADAGSVYLLYGNAAYGNASAQVGSTLTGTAAADSLVGTGGADTLTGGGGADALSGGRGNDVLVVGDNGYRRVDGGAGFDTLRVGAAMTLDFTVAGTATGQNLSGRTRSIEKIDLGVGSVSATLKLSEQDVYQMAGDFDVPAGGTLTGRQKNTLFVLGDSGDTFSFAEGVGGAGGWTATGVVVTNPIGDGNSYVLYTKGTARVYVSTGVSVDDVIAGASLGETLVGGLGTDVIAGNGGDDILYGGQFGSTALTSQAGVKDIFAYSMAANTASGADVIKDFQRGTDRLYLTDVADTDGVPGLSIGDLTQATSPTQYVTFGTDGSGNVRLTLVTGTGTSTVTLEGVPYEATPTAGNGAYGSLAELLGTGEARVAYATADPFGGNLASLP